MDFSSRDVRVSSMMRGLFIAGLMLAYTWVFNQPGVSLKVAFLVAAGFQFAVILLRRLVPRDALPLAMVVFEMIADGVSVLMFALGVFGGIARVSTLA
jgi:hypothetical protein